MIYLLSVDVNYENDTRLVTQDLQQLLDEYKKYWNVDCHIEVWDKGVLQFTYFNNSLDGDFTGLEVSYTNPDSEIWYSRIGKFSF